MGINRFSWVLVLGVAGSLLGCSSEPACNVSAPINGTGTPTITFTSAPPLGSTNNLTGTVNHVAPGSYSVVVYINVDATWYVKPLAGAPLTAINCDGSWTAEIVTGGYDQDATIIDAFVIPSSYDPPGTGPGEGGQVYDPTFPAALMTVAVTSTTVTR